MPGQVAAWIAEHRNFEKLLDIMERELDLFRSGERSNYGLMLDIVYYMTRYPDRFHHPKEDAAFERMLRRDSSAARLVESLHRQHDVIARSGKALQAQLDCVMAGVMLPRAHVEQPAREYIDYFRRHMQTEERLVFPLLQRVLGDEDWNAIGSKIPEGADPLFGGSREDRYRLLHRQIAREVGCDCPVA
jgi:hemerythrin-like domain-containing protein